MVSGGGGGPAAQLATLRSAVLQLLPGAGPTIDPLQLWQLVRLRMRLFMSAAAEPAAAVNGSLCLLRDTLAAAANVLLATNGVWEVRTSSQPAIV